MISEKIVYGTIIELDTRDRPICRNGRVDKVIVTLELTDLKKEKFDWFEKDFDSFSSVILEALISDNRQVELIYKINKNGRNELIECRWK